ncbi:MAG: bifunctional diaminohydroxyphosphoribosylaminopyrimidine deaminase/5-amino-6-(5-phosphoribosylamino)uracil reductase RibD [Acidobacteria bacterium]|nr:MAG: bifunctional diaminohydroxyphosphoribosylaminopyrimidine deaminase/5-amino-6-(5-phosphoribosylamino)uracil reductase RibD [Acidobacteriota bacterium]
MDQYYLNLAYHLALQSEGNTSPNPSVGAVIVHSDQVIAQAFHPAAGSPHAEVLAIEQAGRRAAGATLYCSLEPCAHHGKTGPCVDAIINAKIAKVVFAAIDKNPQVNGRGAEILQQRGIHVKHLPIRLIDQFYEPFFQSFQSGRPYVYAKVAMTANGIISPADRNSRWITNETSLSWVHQLRARCDAILVGADTVIMDRPHLTVRAPGISRQITRIVLDNRFKLTPDDCSLLQNDAPILICGSDQAPPDKESIWKNTPVRTIRFSNAAALLTNLLEMGMRKVVLEGGQKVFTLFHSAGLIDEYILMTAPRLLTGRHFLNMFGGSEQSLSETKRYRMAPPLQLDGDVVLRLKRSV